MMNELLTESNYFSADMNQFYMGSSQFKAFQSCQARAKAVLSGQWQNESSTALLVGSFVDSHFSNTLDLFRAQNPEIFTKSGSLKSEYQHAEYIIQRIERDELFMAFLAGEQQKIMTGVIESVPFKVKIDSYHHNYMIVDLKIMKDFAPVWVEGEGKLPFIEAWSYDTQASIYQEIARQNVGMQLPFYIAAATKEKPEPDIGIFQIPQHRLDYALDLVKHYAPEYQAIKLGQAEPERCGKCDYCKHTKILTEIIDYTEAI